jgi:hypothetical protein
MCGAIIKATRRYWHVPRAAILAATSTSMLPARITSRHRSRPVISYRKPELAATCRPRRLWLSAVARPADSATVRSPTLADRRLPDTPPPRPTIGHLYPPNAYSLSHSLLHHNTAYRDSTAIALTLSMTSTISASNLLPRSAILAPTSCPN